ncbi:hypothetical protein RM530_11855 [Algiphilus sp. W345]|uniref:Uncharacterized protein n=1 Tax=Banduia mediterranea TaxID=3075609 RepID=A0ABU2WJM1_9GAMM|nr:hypothetical protein [Algiphilus sp. W345]MDT0498052.1 hypothetical protein [Algiphilus sp. W345]
MFIEPGAEPPRAERVTDAVYQRGSGANTFIPAERFPPGADTRGTLRDARLIDLGACLILFANRLDHEDARPLGWLRTFIDLGNNLGRDAFYSIDVWDGVRQRDLQADAQTSLRLEGVVPEERGAWVVVLRRERTHRGAVFSDSTWQVDALEAPYFACPSGPE